MATFCGGFVRLPANDCSRSVRDGIEKLWPNSVVAFICPTDFCFYYFFVDVLMVCCLTFPIPLCAVGYLCG